MSSRVVKAWTLESDRHESDKNSNSLTALSLGKIFNPVWASIYSLGWSIKSGILQSTLHTTGQIVDIQEIVITRWQYRFDDTPDACVLDFKHQLERCLQSEDNT